MDHPDMASAEVHVNGGGQVWREEGWVSGEPIFLPRPGGMEEDDGVALTVVPDSTLLRSDSGHRDNGRNCKDRYENSTTHCTSSPPHGIPGL